MERIQRFPLIIRRQGLPRSLRQLIRTICLTLSFEYGLGIWWSISGIIVWELHRREIVRCKIVTPYRWPNRSITDNAKTSEVSPIRLWSPSKIFESLTAGGRSAIVLKTHSWPHLWVHKSRKVQPSTSLTLVNWRPMATFVYGCSITRPTKSMSSCPTYPQAGNEDDVSFGDLV